MKLRTKMKRAELKIIRQQEKIDALVRGNDYLCGLCEKQGKKFFGEIKKLETERDLLHTILDRAAVEAGSIEIQTETMLEVLEGYDITYGADPKTHKIRITANKKEQKVTGKLENA